MIVAAVLPRRAPPAGSAPPPSVALIVPAVDEEERLPATLAALGRLDYPADRCSVILVDDGSTDRSAELMADVGEQPGRRAALSLGRASRQGRGPEQRSRGRSRIPIWSSCATRTSVPAPSCCGPSPPSSATSRSARHPPSLCRRTRTTGSSPATARSNPGCTSSIACAAWDRVGVGPAANGCVAYRSEALASVGGFDGARPRRGRPHRLGPVRARVDSAVQRRGHRRRRRGLDPSGIPPAAPPLEPEPPDGVGRSRCEGRPDAARRAATAASRFRALERRIHSAGYADRVVLAAAFALAAAGRLPRALPGAYVAVLAVDVATAVVKAGRPAEVPALPGRGGRLLPGGRRRLRHRNRRPRGIARPALAGHSLEQRLTWQLVDPGRPRRPSRRGRSGPGAGRALGSRSARAPRARTLPADALPAARPRPRPETRGRTVGRRPRCTWWRDDRSTGPPGREASRSVPRGARPAGGARPRSPGHPRR